MQEEAVNNSASKHNLTCELKFINKQAQTNTVSALKNLVAA